MTAIEVPLVRAARMHSLLLAEQEQRTPLEVATWFGAMQAQDAASGHWSLGVRCADSSEADVLAAFENHDLVRTWPMRGTIHIVPAIDVRWMLALTSPKMLSSAESRRERLGLTLKDADRAATALSQELNSRSVLTRKEAIAVIAAEGVDVTEQRAYHVLWHTAQLGVTCIGPQRGGDQTFVLLDDWAPRQVQLERDDALAEWFLRFVRSHGPVPLKDFAGWTGLSMADCRTAAMGNDGRLVLLETTAGQMWATAEMAARIGDGSLSTHEVLALPGFDEFILGYKDRSLHVPAGGMDQIVPGGNGIFRATIVVDGEAVATWKRTMRASTVAVEIDPIARMSARTRAGAQTALQAYAAFIGRKLALAKA